MLSPSLVVYSIYPKCETWNGKFPMTIEPPKIEAHVKNGSKSIISKLNFCWRHLRSRFLLLRAKRVWMIIEKYSKFIGMYPLEKLCHVRKKSRVYYIFVINGQIS